MRSLINAKTLGRSYLFTLPNLDPLTHQTANRRRHPLHLTTAHLQKHCLTFEQIQPLYLALYSLTNSYATMPPANTRKRKSTEMEDEPAPTATPTGSPRKKMRISQSQKQALMDNLQLESE